MKYLFAGFLIFLFPQIQFGQYQSIFGKDSTQWNVVIEITDYFNDYGYVLKAYRDTSISGTTYKIIYDCRSINNKIKLGYIREDTTNGKVWFNDLNGIETLIMDCELNVGDTFNFDYFGKYTVDTIYYKGGRKCLSFNESNPDSILFIEGIGPFNFLYLGLGTVLDETKIKCMFKDNLLVYKNSVYDNCEFSESINIETERNTLKIFPNPTHNKICVSFPNESIDVIEIYNNNGILVFRNNSIREINEIDFSSMPEGMYFVRAISNGRCIFTKFLKI